MNANSRRSKPVSHQPIAAASLHAPLARLLRPLVRLCIRGGMTFPALAQLLRELFVNVAEHDFALEGKEQTDSRVSLLTGIHRKEVARLRGAGTPVNETPATLSLTSAIIARLRGRFPDIVGPRTDDICYATTNRQAAVKQMADGCDLMLVIGSRNSSNSLRLVEVARDCGTEAHLIDKAAEVSEEWLAGKRVVGISSGASAPENLVQELVDFFRQRGVRDISEFHVISEDVRFMLPKPIRDLASAGEAR